MRSGSILGFKLLNMAVSHYKLDLHTHSIRSHDGSITKAQYREVLEAKKLDYIAITDHNAIDFAVEVQQAVGEKIIVGEEIWTNEGEVIGLYLTKKVPRDLSLAETFAQIKEQGGLIYIPHPFTRNRFGVSTTALLPLIDQVDIMEYFNPRNFVHNDNKQAQQFILKQKKIMAASSDSHCAGELGHTFTTVQGVPTVKTLVWQVKTATYVCRYTPLMHLLCPKKNKLKKMLHIL